MSVNATVISTKRQILSSLARWQGRVEANAMPLFQAFVEDTLGRLRGPFLASHPPLEVLELLEQAFLFARHRTQESIKVDIREGLHHGALTLTNMTDQAFIVDTVRLFLKRNQAEFWGGFNLVFHAQRDEQGHLIGIGNEESTIESLVLLESDTGSLLENTQSAKTLTNNLAFAKAMVSDFVPMTSTIEHWVEKFESLSERRPEKSDDWHESAAFLKWLLRENFVFMGVDATEPLGVQRQQLGEYFSDDGGEWPPAHDPQTVRVRKSHLESPVHRAGRIDEILVTIPGDDQSLFIRGMFTYRAVTQPSRNVPILRIVLSSILDNQQSHPGSFRYKGIANVFDSLPTEFLFTASRHSIAEMVDLVFEAEQQQEVGVTFQLTGPDNAFCLIAMPKSEYSEELRQKVEQVLIATTHATYTDHGLFIGRYETVLLHYYLTGVLSPGADGVVRLTDAIRRLATPWLARLWATITEHYGEGVAERLTDTYGRAFPEAWARATPMERILRDIDLLESLSGAKNVVADLFQSSDGLTLNLYQAKDIFLTDILPVLDNFGLVVRDSESIPITPRGGRLFLESFHLEAKQGVGKDVDILQNRALLIDAIEAAFAGAAEADRLNELVLSAGLTWEEVDVIRGLTRYLRQLNVKIAAVRMREILLAQPKLSSDLIKLFHARFDPKIKSDKRPELLSAAEEQVRDSLRHIRAHDEDLLFGSLFGLINGMLRTNYYRPDRKFHYLSFKFDGSKIREMGSRRPVFEVFVHHKEVEGVHLRFGKVARGGIRWSDRDDFRTEVLDLVTTQQVKNVVIVPEGAKGGYLLKRGSRDPQLLRQEADLHYQTFIRGLLDLTDNSRDNLIIPPPGVVRHDGDDPYLVVAADKGTAHLSDTANQLSAEYGHWLGDAFASGGSNGYDHKKVGITALGAWMLVRRHFAELGIDPYSETFTSAGIGDMSGDVFGNGMIETPHMRLVAAFNHSHIFLDPEPDPQVSFDERLRLFKAERKGGWNNYDTTKISPGGGIFEKSAKSIPLSPQVQQRLGLFELEAEPERVVHHILKMKVDLLWNGGIGTYVKAQVETENDVGDRSNDNVRVNGCELGARIIGEGGNLGFTQKGRIEAALAGIRLNTDAIDNSGGVDLSDHEVNLKILLDRVVTRGDLTLEQRNDLLRRMTDEVARLVMADNDAQGRQLSRDILRSKKNIYQFGRAIAFIETRMNQSRIALNLPSEQELQRRAEANIGLTRPELSVLSAWVKMFIFRELMRGTPKELPGYEYLLINYFPKELQQRFSDDIRQHMLADEIAMTAATTRLVADAGATLIPMLSETSGASVQAITTAYFRAQLLARTQDTRTLVESLPLGDTLFATYQIWNELDAGIRDVASIWLARGRTPAKEALPAMSAAVDEVYSLQSAEIVEQLHARRVQLIQTGIDDEIADLILKAQFLAMSLLVHAEAERLGVNTSEMIVRHLAVAQASRLQEIIDDLEHRPATGRWDPIALRVLHHRLANILRGLVVRTTVPDPLPSVDILTPQLATGQLAEVHELISNLLAIEPQPTLPALIVLEERLSSLISRLGEPQKVKA